MSIATEQAAPERTRVLWLSTIAFTLMLNVWLMLGVLAKPIREEFSLTPSQVEWLIAVAILSGSIVRLNTGIWADRYGGRLIFTLLLLVSAVPTYLFTWATTYNELFVYALLFGLAGNSFSAGVAWCSAWYPPQSKGLALGVFGAGNVGASGTKMLLVLVPTILTIVPAGGYLGGLIPGGRRIIPAVYSALLVLMAVAVWTLAPTPDRKPALGRSMAELLAPLKYSRVWRFSLYYVVVFGAYVALASWLPMYYVDTYKMPLRDAALLTAVFIFPASLLRPLGGMLSDRYGPRVVTYAVFLVMTAALLALSVPNGTYLGYEYKLNVTLFTVLVFFVGCCMGIGKASVYKYIPNYFPRDVGAVGGLVGMLGAFGGFFLPPVFGWLGRTTGVPQMAFLALLVLTVASLAWLHLAVLGMRASEPQVVVAPV